MPFTVRRVVLGGELDVAVGEVGGGAVDVLGIGTILTMGVLDGTKKQYRVTVVSPTMMLPCRAGQLGAYCTAQLRGTDTSAAP